MPARKPRRTLDDWQRAIKQLDWSDHLRDRRYRQRFVNASAVCGDSDDGCTDPVENCTESFKCER